MGVGRRMPRSGGGPPLIPAMTEGDAGRTDGEIKCELAGVHTLNIPVGRAGGIQLAVVLTYTPVCPARCRRATMTGSIIIGGYQRRAIVGAVAAVMSLRISLGPCRGALMPCRCGRDRCTYLHGSAPQRGMAEALAVKDGKIACLSEIAVDCQVMGGAPRTQVFCGLNGKLVLPGLFRFAYPSARPSFEFDVCQSRQPAAGKTLRRPVPASCRPAPASTNWPPR